MRGSVKYQVQQLFAQSGINCIGESRHDAKEAARSTGAGTSAEIGAQLGIHSYNTADAYRGVWRQVLEIARLEYGTKDIEKLSAEHIRAFLDTKIELGVAHATFCQYAAACSKLQQALTNYAERTASWQRYDFVTTIGEARREANAELDRFTGSRAYANPTELERAIDRDDYRLAALIQHQGGARINDVGLIRQQQLRGIVTDGITGQSKGAFSIKSKGGKANIVYVDIGSYHALARHIKQCGDFKIDKDDYRTSLQKAAAATGQQYNGSHGLRWNYAREFYREVQRKGLSRLEALLCTSARMSHNRLQITTHYLS